jgi:hypothetical protein
MGSEESLHLLACFIPFHSPLQILVEEFRIEIGTTVTVGLPRIGPYILRPMAEHQLYQVDPVFLNDGGEAVGIPSAHTATGRGATLK